MTVEMGTTYVEPGANAFDRYNLDEELLNESNNELEPISDPIDISDRTLPVTITGIVNTNVPEHIQEHIQLILQVTIL